MSTQPTKPSTGENIDHLYEESAHWELNTGDTTIHAKRMPGTWRTIKWLSAAVWLIFFLGPYLRWDGRQAVLFDIPNRQFHIFSSTILPQDFWMLSLLLLFFAILLAVATALVGRVWCGFFCFQTVWTDVFTWLEEKLEGTPQKRRKLDGEPLSFAKIKVKVPKHLLWLLISVLTGISFAAWFIDAFALWGSLLTLQASSTAIIVILLFTAGTYTLAGILREQTCLWLCPYARIQGVMIDRTTILPTYDVARGELRGRRKKGQDDSHLGDCVDCGQCYAVCPTGVDIREGQQEGCITCALCIDACDAVMDKINKPRGLVRYASLDEIEGLPFQAMHKRPRVWVYVAILTLALAGIGYGLMALDKVGLKVLHERQPLFVQLSDGHIQNKYTLKVLNKMMIPAKVKVTASGLSGIELVGAEEPIDVVASGVTPWTVFVKIPAAELKEETQPILFTVETTGPDGAPIRSQRESIFIGPR